MNFDEGDRVVIANDLGNVLDAYHYRVGVIVQLHNDGNVANVRLDHHPYKKDEPGDVNCMVHILRLEQHIIEELPV